MISLMLKALPLYNCYCSFVRLSDLLSIGLPGKVIVCLLGGSSEEQGWLQEAGRKVPSWMGLETGYPVAAIQKRVKYYF